MQTKPGENRSEKPKADEADTRGGGLGPTKGARKQDKPRGTDELLDEALEESFPASDPPAQTVPGVQTDKPKAKP